MTSCIIGVIANIFVPYLILTVRRLKTVTNVFVFSICLCNVFVGEYTRNIEILKAFNHGASFLQAKFVYTRYQKTPFHTSGPL